MVGIGKTILITGATRGIGLEIARSLALKAYNLILCGSSEQSAQSLLAEPFVERSGALVHSVNLADAKSVSDFAQEMRGVQLWGIVNNAGICKTSNILSDGDDPFVEVMETNLFGPYRLTKSLLPILTRPGRIVNIASQLGQEGRAGYSAYCASKFGLIGMTKCWAKELGSAGITVNAVCPGWVDTEMSRFDMQRMADQASISIDNYFEEVCRPLELRRFNSTTEVANLVAFLLSDEASGITGRDWLMQTLWNQR